MFSGSTVFTVFLFQKSQIKQHIQLKFNKIVDVVNPKPVPLELDDELCNTVRDSIYFSNFLGRIVFKFLQVFTK